MGYSTSDLSLCDTDLGVVRTGTLWLMRREFSAGGVLVRRMRGRWWVALVRPRRDDGKAVWALPKGLIDEGERGAETAIREAFEETGVEAALDRKLGDIRYVYTWDGERIFKVVSFFLVRWRGGRLGDIAPEFAIEIAAKAVEALTRL